MAVDRELAKKLKAIADDRDLTMSEAIEAIAGTAITREYRKVVEKLHAKVIGGES